MGRKMIDTSLAAYEDIKPKLNRKQQAVMEVILKLGGRATNEQIAERMGVSVHTISPRTGELMSFNMICRGDRVKNKSGKPAYEYIVVSRDQNQLMLFQ